MQRDGQDQIGTGDQFGAGTGQPASECGRGMGAVAMFETENQITSDTAINHDRAGPVVNRRPADTGAAQGGFALVQFEGVAATMAMGPREKINVMPAWRADAARHANDDIAGEALGRQNSVQGGAPDLTAKPGQSSGKVGYGHHALPPGAWGALCTNEPLVPYCRMS